MSNTNDSIRAAVKTSINTTSIAHVSVDDAASAVVALKSVAAESGLELDWCDMGDGTTDVWAFEADAPEGEMVWRLHIEQTFATESRVCGGEGEDYDEGTVDSVDGDQVTVRWDSGVTSTQPASLLRAL